MSILFTVLVLILYKKGSSFPLKGNGDRFWPLLRPMGVLSDKNDVFLLTIHSNTHWRSLLVPEEKTFEVVKPGRHLQLLHD